MRKHVSLPVRLGLLVAGTALPLIVFAAAIVYQHHIERREEAFNRVLQLVRSTRLVLDSETQRVVAGLQVLGQSNAVQRGDFQAFRNNARAFLSQYPDKATIVVGDREGRVLFNSDVASGEPLPERVVRPDRDEVFRTMRGIDYDGLDRSIDGRVSKLRRKLGDDAAAPTRIKTVWGKGYLLVPDAWEIAV